MAGALLISVRFHDGRYHGAGDWPPSPARLFQALVASAAKPALERGSCDALKWLEELAAPVIAAPAAHFGQHVSLFVPNNDLDTKGGDIRRVGEIRSATKHIRPRLFDASVPLLYVWRFDVDNAHAECVRDIADGLFQLGRGVDMAWAVGEVLDDVEADIRLSECLGVIYRPSAGGQGVALNCPEEGSLESLKARHQAGARRFRRVGKKTQFSNAPKPRFRLVSYNSPQSRLLFDLRRTTATGSPFAPWPLSRIAALVHKLRGNDGGDGQPKSGAFARLAQHFDAGVIGKVLIGRDAKDADKALRLRIVPLPSIGHMHADRGIRRVLVEVPPDSPIRANDVAWAFSGLEVEPSEVDADGVIVSSPVELVSAMDDSMLEHYGLEGSAPSRLWRSVTPLALPESAARRRIDPAERRAQAKNGAERFSEHQRACREVAQALRHVGIKKVITGLRVQRESFEAKGERAEAFSDGTRFSKHRLWHVEVEFAEPVVGPLILGDGRYTGLGLFCPVRRVEGVHCFSIVEGLADRVDEVAVCRALRRAVMSRVQDSLGPRQRLLPRFFSGHEPDGASASDPSHSHLAFVVDLMRRRLIVVAPHVLQGRSASREEADQLQTLDAALGGLVDLRAGASGRLQLVPVALDLGSDPLFRAACEWESVTEYRPARHHKRMSETDALVHDVRVELERRGLPVPESIGVHKVLVGPRGGLSGTLRIVFRVAVSGPLLLGRTQHMGGGLFAAAQ